MIGWLLGGLTVGLLGLCAIGPVRRLFRDVSHERAHELFHLQREMLEARFFELARSADHPKGLLWADCEFENEALFARHRKTGELIALVEATVHFDLAVQRSADLGQPVGTERQATAVFHYQHGQWGTVGRILFDLSPEESLRQFEKDYAPLRFQQAG